MSETTKVLLSCPNCGQRLSADKRLVGKMAKCGRCKQDFPVTDIDSTSVMPSVGSLPLSRLASEAMLNDTSEHPPPPPKNADASRNLPVPPNAPSNANLIPCEDCGKTISKRATFCPSCGAPTQKGVAAAPIPEVILLSESESHESPLQEERISVRSSGNGILYCTGPYKGLFSSTKLALVACQVKIRKSSESTGEIEGKVPYGLNLFGMSVYVCLSSSGSQTKIEIKAYFTDAFDTFGACRNKVTQIVEQLTDTINATNHTAAEFGVFPGLQVTPRLGPKSGPSHLGKALTVFFVSLVGLLYWPLAVAGLIMSSSVYSSIASSRNKSGSGWALCGLTIAFVRVIFAVTSVIKYFQISFPG